MEWMGEETLCKPTNTLSPFPPLVNSNRRMQGQLTSKSIKYSGFASTVTIIVKEEGIRGLFGGFSASLLGSLTGQTLYFASYEMVKRNLLDWHLNPEMSYFIGGGLADVAASMLYVPSEVGLRDINVA